MAQKAKQKSNKKEHKRKTPAIKSNYLSWAYLLLALFIFVVSLIMRTYAFGAPIMGDEATYVILGKKAMMGEIPFTDFYEMKPPLLYYCYGLGSLLFGWSETGVRLLGFSLVLLNSFLIFMTGKEFSSKPFAFLMAAISLFIMNNIYLHGTETVSEHFMVTFVLSGFYFLIKKVFKKYYLNIFIAGFLICGAAMVKQTAAVFGLGAILFIVIESFLQRFHYEKSKLFKSILFLGLGALMIIFLSLLPNIISGSMADAHYWLIEFPTSYINTISVKEGLGYLQLFVGWAIDFQYFTMILLLISILGLFLSYRQKYFSFFLILLLCSFLNTTPGFRFYGHYWIPFFIMLPLCLIGWRDFLMRFHRKKYLENILPVVVFITFSADLARKNENYFEKNYVNNAESAYSGNYPAVIAYMLDQLKGRMLPHETFSVLGTQLEAYIILNRFPTNKHIYPKLIGKPSPRNKIYQKEAFAELSETKPDYVFLSVTGQSWRPNGDFDDWLYNESFSYVQRNYKPLIVYNTDENKLYNAETTTVDLYKPNQLITFKRK